MIPHAHDQPVRRGEGPPGDSPEAPYKPVMGECTRTGRPDCISLADRKTLGQPRSAATVHAQSLTGWSTVSVCEAACSAICSDYMRPELIIALYAKHYKTSPYYKAYSSISAEQCVRRCLNSVNNVNNNKGRPTLNNVKIFFEHYPNVKTQS